MKKETSPWIDVHNDKVMREMGFFRPYDQTNIDWSKTAKERKLLRRLKHSIKKKDMHFHAMPKPRKMVVAKLIVYLAPNKEFPKSVYSFQCSNTSVNEILSKFQIYNRAIRCSETVVKKYSFNGKTYGPKERL